MIDPDLSDFHKRKSAPEELRLRLRQQFFYKDGDITTLIAQRPRFNILQHSNCKDLEDGDKVEQDVLVKDYLAKCVEQITNRLDDNRASLQRIIEHVLEICQYFFQKHTIS